MKIIVKLILLTSAIIASALVMAQQSATNAINSGITGNWVINQSLSDNTDDQVEAAIKAGGGKAARRWFDKRDDDFYRGGPAEQELYDRISYDPVLRIEIEEPEFRFYYADDYVRVFHSDSRKRSTTANDFYSEGGADFSFANWDGKALIVEARPRDGGFTLETYSLQAEGEQLRVVMVIEPESFRGAINLVRVYDRVD